jgi:hypothetical protein
MDDQHKTQEREQDRLNQQGVLARYCAVKGDGWTFTQTNRGSAFDGHILYKGIRAELAEVKCRTCTFEAFEKDGYRIDTHKIKFLVDCGRTYRVPAVLLVRWKCGTHGAVNLSQSGTAFPTKLVKRGDRNELPDLQSDIPMSLFTKF